MQPFTYVADPVRVIFGRGTVDKVADEVRRLGKARALVLSTPRRRAADDLARKLGPLAAGVLADATMHAPVEVTERALHTVTGLDADCLVAIGGGSAIGLGKALALRTGLALIAVPTTYSGSEATAIIGQTRGKEKLTERSAAILPRAIVYDVDLTLGLPVAVSVTSGINAIAHSVEALYARDANPVTSLMAEEGIRSIARALPQIAARPDDAEARSDALYGAWLCGTSLNAVGMALHHKLCHTLGGLLDLPHAETHTVVLPHATAFNAAAAPVAMQRIARALGVGHAAQGLYDLAAGLGAPVSLAALGMKPADLERAVDLAIKSPYWNPQPIERAGIHALLDDALNGRRPG